MKLYHGTTLTARTAILADGFRDGCGHYMTRREHRGVWLSDRLLDENEGVSTEAVLIVDIDASLIGPYEWVNEPSMGYREFLVPAAILNAHSSRGRAAWARKWSRRATTPLL